MANGKVIFVGYAVNTKKALKEKGAEMCEKRSLSAPPL